MNSKNRGLIALDIDGTCVEIGKAISLALADHLKELASLGWIVFFITGRPFSFAKQAFGHFDFPFYLGVQNGTDIMRYPTQELIDQRYLDASHVSELASFYSDYIVYSGYEKGDFCYYAPSQMSHKQGGYFHRLMETTSAPWVEVNSPEDLQGQKQIPLIKCFGDLKALERVESACTWANGSIIQDTIDPNSYILLLTAPDANKGEAVDHLACITQVSGPIIVAGDDRNDISMFRKATLSMGVVGGPEELLVHADKVIASPADEGLLKGLQEVIDRDGSFIGN